ncbi:type 4a pilus biogenesis protein PilO [Polaromonas sp.]|jgi:type IV pilus assembly protein PilO|uniref:type 4a pilus biogenesis protein PilO n=1 Tax=Polaromonas sp. TaxID=1869339 RepID=UPI001D1B24B6|nr:type 4a pilus biogenesis protein PilO [Polaromonas sp.]MBT9476921.1 type 4a pilus biogenesis protein PilO [Polaromonas sp.]
MANIPKPSIGFADIKSKLQAQFSGLDPNDPPSWPALPRYLLCLAVTAFVVVALWFSWLNTSDAELTAAKADEVQLKEDYKKKLKQAVNLEALKRQREQVQQYVVQLEKQLPSKAEMDALLSDINQAGLGRSLQFELFRPGQVSVKDYYAELPIAVRVTGRYHDMGAFAADIANLSRIVTLNNMRIDAGKDGNLVMDTTAKTFRYLDEEEIALQRKSAPAKGAKK